MIAKKRMPSPSLREHADIAGDADEAHAHAIEPRRGPETRRERHDGDLSAFTVKCRSCRRRHD